jgi:hypothetical protein
VHIPSVHVASRLLDDLAAVGASGTAMHRIFWRQARTSGSYRKFSVIIP